MHVKTFHDGKKCEKFPIQFVILQFSLISKYALHTKGSYSIIHTSKAIEFAGDISEFFAVTLFGRPSHSAHTHIVLCNLAISDA